MSSQSQVIGTEELARKFGALDDAVQGEKLTAAVMSGALVLRNAAVDNIKEQGLILTRNLSRSIHSEVVEQSPKHVEVDTGTDVEYAAIHEFGGVIKAKSGKYLAIPVGSYKGSPRGRDDLSPRKTSGGSFVLVDGSGAVQYVLKKSVIVKARPYMRPAMDENEQEIQDKIGAALKILVDQAAA